MKTIVITGSTRGIGFAMEKAFLRKGCQVVVSGRKAKSVNDAVQTLAGEFSSDAVAGFVCDVSHYEQLESLWESSVKKFGKVDIWINNAGISHHQTTPWDIPQDEIRCVIETNVLGEMYGSRVAMHGFLKQGFGALYNMEGMGANRRSANVKGLSVYGSSKAGLRYFNDCLADENTNPRICIGSLQPGMMLTDMIRDRYQDKSDQWEKDKRIFDVLASDVDQVADWLTDRMLANTKNGARFVFMNSWKLFGRFMKMPFKNRE